MKGILFTEFLDMIETKFGYEVVDELIESMVAILLVRRYLNTRKEKQ